MAAITGAVIAAGTLAASVDANKASRRAQDRATEAQIQGRQEAIASQEAAQDQATELTSPFIEFGAGQLGPLQQAIIPQTQEQEFAQLQSNPIFQAAREEGRMNVRGGLANKGLIGSGEESRRLTNNLFLSAAPLLQQQRAQRQQNVQNLFGATGIGQASSVGQAANIFGTAANVGNLQQGIGTTAGQGIENVANIRGRGIEDVISQLPGAANRVSGLFTPPPDPFFNREFGFDAGVGDPFSAGGL